MADEAQHLENALRAIGDHRRYWEIQRDALVIQAAFAAAIEFEYTDLEWEWLQFAHPMTVNPADVLREMGGEWQAIDFAAFDQARAYMAQEVEFTHD